MSSPTSPLLDVLSNSTLNVFPKYSPYSKINTLIIWEVWKSWNDSFLRDYIPFTHRRTKNRKWHWERDTWSETKTQHVGTSRPACTLHFREKCMRSRGNNIETCKTGKYHRNVQKFIIFLATRHLSKLSPQTKSKLVRKCYPNLKNLTTKRKLKFKSMTKLS